MAFHVPTAQERMRTIAERMVLAQRARHRKREREGRSSYTPRTYEPADESYQPTGRAARRRSS